MAVTSKLGTRAHLAPTGFQARILDTVRWTTSKINHWEELLETPLKPFEDSPLLKTLKNRSNLWRSVRRTFETPLRIRNHLRRLCQMLRTHWKCPNKGILKVRIEGWLIATTAPTSTRATPTTCWHWRTPSTTTTPSGTTPRREIALVSYNCQYFPPKPKITLFED